MGKSMLNGVCYGSDDANDINYDNTNSGLEATNVQGAIDKLNSNLPFKLGIDANGNYGYIKAGADSVTPFKKGYEDTPGTATAAQIASGKTAWVNGKQITGTAQLAPASLNGTVSVGKRSWGDKVVGTVTFSTAFATTPTVQITASGGNLGTGGVDYVKTTSVTKAGFNWELEVAGTTGAGYTTLTLTWNAVA